jgi:type II secretory pathway pseudopilin PulG
VTSLHPIRNGPFAARRSLRVAAFTLVELLTVIFIISLLIGILVPTIRGARNAAKKATTAKTIDTIKVALEMFKNENQSDFGQTGGYPPSFAHPPIPGFAFDAYEGKCPFVDQTPPVVFGAQWLPATLMGFDANGYIARSSVPKKNNLEKQPWDWYKPDPLGDGTLIARQQLYLDPNKTRTVATEQLVGKPNSTLFPDWDKVKRLRVIVDAFDMPILYYVASPHGRPTNMTADKRDKDNNYSGGVQEVGVPYYFHQDNEGFTGNETQDGWDFGGRPTGHAIAKPGDKLTPVELLDPANKETFAHYIVDRKIYAEMVAAAQANNPPPDTTQLRPVNADSFLLISAGPDSRFGTIDDVSNLPPFPEE